MVFSWSEKHKLISLLNNVSGGGLSETESIFDISIPPRRAIRGGATAD